FWRKHGDNGALVGDTFVIVIHHCAPQRDTAKDQFVALCVFERVVEAVAGMETMLAQDRLPLYLQCLTYPDLTPIVIAQAWCTVFVYLHKVPVIISHCCTFLYAR